MKMLIIILGLTFSTSSFGQLVNDENLKRQQYYDSTLNEINFRDPKSVEDKFGSTDNMIDPQDDMTEVLSKNGNQILTMIFHPGGTLNYFSEFKVERNTGRVKSKYKIGDREFVTGKGVKLGINELSLVAMLGEPRDKEKDGEYLKYSYRQEGELYFGCYWFKNGRLEKFWFGEEYP